MIIQLPLMLHNIISKQFKISHVPCDVIAFKKEDIPANIKKLIDKQYDEKFLEDCDIVIFVKGPIDKDMRKKIFKAADKALGEGANMMNEQDFRLLKLHDDDNTDFGVEKDDDQTEEQAIDDQVNDIVNEPDDANVEIDDGDDDLEDNDSAVEDALTNESIEDNSIDAAIHQGKSMRQWEKEFKGEFTVNQLWKMARSGTDLQRLLLTMSGVVSLDDSEKLDESKSKKDKEDEGEEDENKEEEEKEEEEEDNEEDKEEDKDDEEKEDVKDDKSNVELTTVPTRFVFLKISMKS